MAVVWKSGWFIAHAWIADQANYFLESAEDKNRLDGITGNCAAALVFGSFCVEAFLNSAGRVWVPHWDLLEKKLQPKEKLRLICSALDIQLEPDKPPFNCVPDLFKFRNWIAHGKDERVRERVVIKPGEERNAAWGAPRHEQQRKLSSKMVRLYLEKADALIDLIEKKSKRKRKIIPMFQTSVTTSGRQKD
jgi:hypothetical protein